MKVEIKYFNVEVDGELNDDHPMFFKTLHIVYEFKGEKLDIEKIQKAIKLSQERYCGVSATLSKSVNITYEIKILD